MHRRETILSHHLHTCWKATTRCTRCRRLAAAAVYHILCAYTLFIPNLRATAHNTTNNQHPHNTHDVVTPVPDCPYHSIICSNVWSGFYSSTTRRPFQTAASLPRPRPIRTPLCGRLLQQPRRKVTKLPKEVGETTIDDTLPTLAERLFMKSTSNFSTARTNQ